MSAKPVTKSNKPLIFTLVFTLLLALAIQCRIFTDPNAINDDVRNQMYWMAKLIDPSYFHGDYLADYFSQASMISPIYKVLYQITNNFFDPKLVSQFLPFPIILLTIFFLFKLTELHAGPSFAFWICFVFNLYIWAMKFTAGGLPRSFFYLLFFLFLYLLVQQRWRWLNVCAALQCLIYPTAFFISWVTLIVELVIEKIDKHPFNPKKFQAAISTLAVSLPILYFRYIYKADHSKFGSLFNIQEAIKMPEFYFDKRHAVFVLPSAVATEPLAFLQRLLRSLWHSFPLILMVAAAIYIAYWLLDKFILSKTQRVKQPKYILTSVIASLLLFVLAHLALFYLYLPHRFIAYVLPLFAVFLIGTWFYQVDKVFHKKPVLIWSLAVLTILFMWSRMDDDLIKLEIGNQKVINFLKNTPKDSLVAAPMKLASDIPAFAYRSVLISSETDLPYHKLYRKEVQQRVKDLDIIYTTKSATELNQLIAKYGIDYIVVDRQQVKDAALLKITASRTDLSKRYFVISF